MENKTLQYYNQNAKEYIELTRQISSDGENMLMKYLKKEAIILDLGCGSGKASKKFIEMGYQVCAIDGAEEMAKLTSQWIGQEVIVQDIQEISFVEEFDAIYACASLLHIPKEEQKKIFEKLAKAIRKEGYIYASYKYGKFEGIRDGRYYTDFNIKEFKKTIKNITGLKLLESKIVNDDLGRSNKWVNFILKKIG